MIMHAHTYGSGVACYFSLLVKVEEKFRERRKVFKVGRILGVKGFTNSDSHMGKKGKGESI